MTYVLPDDLGQPSNAEIKTEDCSAQTNTAVNRDAVTEHENYQDLPETSGFRKQTAGEYENIQCKHEPTWYWHTAAENSGTVDIACTCNCNNTADFHETKDCVTVAAECGILCTGVCFPGEDNVIKDTCEFTVCVHKSLFSRGFIDRLGVEELKNNIGGFIHTAHARHEDTPRHNKTESSQITKDKCDTAESEATGTAQPQHKHSTCMRRGDDFICTLSVKQHVLDHTRLQSYLCEKCTAASQTSDSEIQVNLETIPDNGESTEGKPAVQSPMFKHTPQQTHMCDGSGKRVSKEFDAEEDKQIYMVQHHFTCATYRRSFIRKRDFDKKNTYQTEEKSVQCTECKNTSSQLYDLQKPRITHAGDKAHMYTYCERPKHSMTTQLGVYNQSLENTNETTASRKPTQYSFRNIEVPKDEIKDSCNRSAQSQNQVDNGTCIPETLDQVKDIDCGTTQSKQTASKGDTNVCTQKKSYLHEHCGKTFGSKRNLDEHLQVHTAERLYKCPECEKAYKCKKDLKFHMRNHMGAIPYRCSFCNSTFMNKCHLTYHLRSHTGDRPYQFSQCGKTYKYYTHLKRHMRTHTGERPYNCTYCHKTFTNKSNLTRHMKTHTGEKPHKCTHCDKTFVRKNALTDHIRVHTGEKPYKCMHCDKTFSIKRNVTYHIRTHTGEKPHKCTHCDKTFTTKSDLTRHIRTHTGEKPYTCIICRKMFTRKENLRRHMVVHTKHDHINAHTMDEGHPQKSNKADTS